jgi:hypothetical protein
MSYTHDPLTQPTSVSQAAALPPIRAFASPVPSLAQPQIEPDQPQSDHLSAPGNLLAKISLSSTAADNPLQRKALGWRLRSRQPIQAKLNIGEPDDRYEQEADAVATKIVAQINTPQSSVQRSSEEEEELQMKPVSSVQRSSEEEEELQMKPVSLRQEPIAGGEASGQLEDSIQRARGGGQGLDTGLQRSMGQAMGADFSQVRVHTDARSDQLNRTLQAKAFTTGKDIFFRQGAYQPTSPSGQELIAHELTHTVQQGSTLLRKAQSPQVSPVVDSAHQVMRSAPRLQRQMVVINDVAHRRTGANQETQVGSKLKAGDTVDITDQDDLHLKKDNIVSWYRLLPLNPQHYIRATKIFKVDVAAGQNPESQTDPLGALNEHGLDTASDGLDKFSKQAENQGQDTSKLDISGGAVSTAGGILGMALSIRDLISSEKGWMDWLSTVWTGLLTAGKLTSNISKIVAGAAENKDAKGVSDWSGSFTGAFETLAGGVQTIKSVIDLIKMWSSDDNYGKEEYAKMSYQITAGALNTARGVVDTVKSFIEIFEGGVEGLSQAIPGLDIAISATKMIVEGYYLATSAFHWSKMKKESAKLEAGLAGNKGGSDKISKAKKSYQEKRAEISNLETRKLSKTAKNDARQEQINSIQEEERSLNAQLQTTSDAKQRKAIQEKLDKLKSKRKDIEKLVQTTQGKITGAAAEIDQKNQEMTAYAASSGISQDDVAELELAEELRSGNRKRIIRQSIHLSTDAAKIAGSIATLTGAGAAAGVALKASAAGVELSLPFFRSLKEFGRKKAAEYQAKGETGGFTQWMFDANKSSGAKLDARKRHTATIFGMVSRLNKLILNGNEKPEEKAAKVKQLNDNVMRVETFIQASGCSPTALYRLNGKPQEQASLLLQSLYKREF